MDVEKKKFITDVVSSAAAIVGVGLAIAATANSSPLIMGAGLFAAAVGVAYHFIGNPVDDKTGQNRGSEKSPPSILTR